MSWFFNKKNRNEQENAAYKLYRLLVEQPHIPLADLQKINCPTLVIGGDHDVIKEEHTFLIYKNIPNSYLWILPASGHSTPIVYKDDFNVTSYPFIGGLIGNDLLRRFNMIINYPKKEIHLLPNKSFKEDAIQMSEMEKIIKQEEKQTQEKNKKREITIKLIIFVLVLSIIIY